MDDAEVLYQQVDGNDRGEEHVYTLDEALAAIGFGRFQVMVLAYAGLGSMCVAIQVMILSFIGPSFRAEWRISSAQESLITTVLFGGMLVGDCLWGLISDRYGRRMGLLSIAVTSVFAFLSAVAPNYASLILFRMMVGFGLGGGPVFSTWFLEFVPVQNRGMWMVVFSLFWTIGTVFEDFLAWIIIPKFGWRWLLAISSVPCFITLILYFFIMESPRYLCLNGKFKDLHDALTKMAKINNIVLPSSIVVSGFTIGNEDESSSSTETTTDLDNSIAFSSFLSLFSPVLARRTLVIWTVFFGYCFMYYSIVLMTSELSSGQSRCVSSKARSLLNQMDSDLYRSVFITSLADLPGILLSAVLIDSIGRRLSLVLMYLFTFVLLLPLMFTQQAIMTTLLLFGARLCVAGTFTIAGVYCPELYPTSVRTTGLGVANAMGRIGSMICPLVAVELVSGCHQVAAVASLEVLNVLVGACVFFVAVEETKGRKLADTLHTLTVE